MFIQKIIEQIKTQHELDLFIVLVFKALERRLDKSLDEIALEYKGETRNCLISLSEKWMELSE